MSDNWEILFGDLATQQMSRISESIVSISVSYSTSLCTQLSIELIDPNFDMLRNNYFIVGRDILYKSKSFIVDDVNSFTAPGLTNPTTDAGRAVNVFEIASVEVRPSAGSSPSILVQARTKAIQQMKRDKNPQNIKGKSSDYVFWAARHYGLQPQIQKTSKSRQISKASGDRQADSTWDVLTNLAGDAKFMIFETDGHLIFCSMDYLMGRWGITQMNHNFFKDSKNNKMVSPLNVVPIAWPPLDAGERAKLFDNPSLFETLRPTSFGDINGADVILPVAMPTLRRSDNDPFVVSGSVQVDRTAGVNMRPGMTIALAGIPTFEDIFMVTGVSFDHLSGQPVSLEFSKPEREGKYIQNYAVGARFADYAELSEGTISVGQNLTDLRIF